jgi:hypothetical protein
MNMIIMKKEINVTQKHQIKDLEDIFFTMKLQKIMRVCKKCPSQKQVCYICSSVCCVTKLVRVQCFHNDNGEKEKFDNPYHNKWVYRSLWIISPCPSILVTCVFLAYLIDPHQSKTIKSQFAKHSIFN